MQQREQGIYQLTRPDISPYRRLFKVLAGHWCGALTEEAKDTFLHLPMFHSTKFCGSLLWTSVCTPFLFDLYRASYSRGVYRRTFRWTVGIRGLFL